MRNLYICFYNVYTASTEFDYPYVFAVFFKQCSGLLPLPKWMCCFAEAFRLGISHITKTEHYLPDAWAAAKNILKTHICGYALKHDLLSSAGKDRHPARGTNSNSVPTVNRDGALVNRFNRKRAWADCRNKIFQRHVNMILQQSESMIKKPVDRV